MHPLVKFMRGIVKCFRFHCPAFLVIMEFVKSMFAIVKPSLGAAQLAAACREMRCFRVVHSMNSLAMKGCWLRSPISWVVQILGMVREGSSLCLAVEAAQRFSVWREAVRKELQRQREPGAILGFTLTKSTYRMIDNTKCLRRHCDSDSDAPASQS
jgi:hypothetical protein